MHFDDYQPTPDTASAETIPSRWYLEPQFLQAEKEKVFWKTWQWVGHASAVAKPGDYLATELLGEPIVIVRGEAGELRALSNVCRHRAGKLVTGCGHAKALRCQYHGWTYGLDGKLLGAREFENVRDWRKEDVRLPAMKAEVWGPFVFVNLDTDARSLAETLAPISTEIAQHGYDLNDFKFAVRKDYEVACNWKVYVDNYQEGYHIPVAHPALFKELDYDQYDVQCYPGYSHHFAPIRQFKPGDPRAQDRRYADDTAKKTLYYWVFPNWMINIYPDNMSINIVVPLSEGRTLTIFEWYFTDEKLARGQKWLEEEASFSDLVQQEDIEICEAVQKGLGSFTYDRGRFSPKRENGVHHFHTLLHKALTGARTE